MSIDTLGKKLDATARSASGAKDPAEQARQQAKLRQACRMFESSFLQTLWKEMRATVPKGGVINGGKGEEMFTGMLDQARADAAVAGRSMGLADMLESQLSRDRVTKVSTGLGQGSLKPLNPGAGQGLKPPAGLKPLRVPVRTGAGEGAVAEKAAAQAQMTLAGLTPGDSVTLPMPPLIDLEEQAPPLGDDTPEEVLAGASTTPSDLAPQPPQAAQADAPPALPGPGQPRQATDFQPPVRGEVSSTFGLRLHPITGEVRPHRGLDLAAPEGTPFQAAKGGVVAFAGNFGEYGKLVVVEHDDGSQAYYGHCQSLQVATGQRVAQGQNIGRVGQTGLATGPHLHFEIRDSHGLAIDPLPLVAGGLNLRA